jgi:hypothetical protein
MRDCNFAMPLCAEQVSSPSCILFVCAALHRCIELMIPFWEMIATLFRPPLSHLILSYCKSEMSFIKYTAHKPDLYSCVDFFNFMALLSTNDLARLFSQRYCVNGFRRPHLG